MGIVFDDLSHTVIGCALQVHSELGPGLLESAYEQCLAHELRSAGLQFRLQVALPVRYKGILIDCGYRIDLLVENAIVVEIKSIEKLLNLHEAQLLTYLKLSQIHTRLLINFNVKALKDGIKRMVL